MRVRTGVGAAVKGESGRDGVGGCEAEWRRDLKQRGIAREIKMKGVQRVKKKESDKWVNVTLGMWEKIPSK